MPLGVRQRALHIVNRRTLALILPVLVEQCCIMALGIVNSAMSSHLGGEVVGAIGVVDTLNNVVISFFSALAVGATVITAQHAGRGDVRLAGETAKQAMYASLALVVVAMAPLLIFREPAFRLLFQITDARLLENTCAYFAWAALSYPAHALISVFGGCLRGAGNARTPMIVTLLMNAVNIIAGLVFIIGIPLPGGYVLGRLGIHGAGLSICLARWTGAGLLLYVMLRGSGTVRLSRPWRYRPDRALLRAIMGIGVPAGTDNLMFNAGKIITQSFVVHAGAVALAANYYSGPLFSILNVPGNALLLAATTLVGMSIGGGDEDDADRTMQNMTLLCMVSSGVLALVMYPFSGLILRLYNADAGAAALVMTYMTMNLLTIPLLWPASFLLPGGLRASGDARYCMVVSMASMWVVRVGLGWVLAEWMGMGLIGVWLGMYADWLVRGIGYVWRLRSGKWRGRRVKPA